MNVALPRTLEDKLEEKWLDTIYIFEGPMKTVTRNLWPKSITFKRPRSAEQRIPVHSLHIDRDVTGAFYQRRSLILRSIWKSTAHVALSTASSEVDILPKVFSIISLLSGFHYFVVMYLVVTYTVVNNSRLLYYVATTQSGHFYTIYIIIHS